jgi:hypothetical protein
VEPKQVRRVERSIARGLHCAVSLCVSVIGIILYEFEVSESASITSRRASGPAHFPAAASEAEHCPPLLPCAKHTTHNTKPNRRAAIIVPTARSDHGFHFWACAFRAWLLLQQRRSCRNDTSEAQGAQGAVALAASERKGASRTRVQQMIPSNRLAKMNSSPGRSSTLKWPARVRGFSLPLVRNTLQSGCHKLLVKTHGQKLSRKQRAHGQCTSASEKTKC